MTGAEFCEKRKAAGLTQEHIEQLAGIPQTKISRFEKGAIQPSEFEMIRLVDALEFRLTLSRPVRIAAATSGESHL